MNSALKLLLYGGAAYLLYEWWAGQQAPAAAATTPAGNTTTTPPPAASPAVTDPAAAAAMAAVNAKAVAQLANLNSGSSSAALIQQAQGLETLAASLTQSISGLAPVNPQYMAITQQVNTLTQQAQQLRAAAAAAPVNQLSQDDINNYAAADYADVVRLSDAMNNKHSADDWNFYRARIIPGLTTTDLFPAGQRDYQMLASEYISRRTAAGLGSYNPWAGMEWLA